MAARRINLSLTIRVRALLVLGLGLAFLFLAGQFLPRWWLLDPGMEPYDSRHFSIWAQAADRRDAIQLRSALEDDAGQAVAFLGLADFPEAKYQVYLYPDRRDFILHLSGLWASWTETAGVVVERRGDQLLLAPPSRPGLGHTHDEVIQEACAAWIRPLVLERTRGELPWLSEGLVMYLAGFSRDDENPEDLPPDTILADRSGFDFLARGGDRFADSFVAWLIRSQGQKAVLDLCATGGDWWGVTGNSPESLVSEWKRWAASGRPGDPRLRRMMPPGDAEQ